MKETLKQEIKENGGIIKFLYFWSFAIMIYILLFGCKIYDKILEFLKIEKEFPNNPKY